MKPASAVRPDHVHIVPDFMRAVMSRKHNSSAPRGVIGDRRLHGIAGVASKSTKLTPF